MQGVGFRPFLYNLACELNLAGYVLNSSAGLTAEVEGDPDAVRAFVRRATEEAPPLAWIQQIETACLPPAGDRSFEIRESLDVTGEFALISPDVATCDACLADVGDPRNRRFLYPFTNCTNCGPRYTIVEDIPYDRPNTTMARFRMCAACRAEYKNPRDRRFHAQPNACPACGPSLSAPIHEAIRQLSEGRIVALKGLGGFHLACDARNAAAVELLRTRKRRSDKPFALMCRDLDAAARICVLSDVERALLAGPQHPIVVLRRREGCGIPEAVAPGNRTLGLMLPYTPLHHLLFRAAPFDTLVMTSGNLSEEPIVTRNGEALDRLRPVADWFLLHNRDIFMRTDDSVVRVFEGVPRLLRRSRSYVPQTVEMRHAMPELLACGGELKNAFCLTKGRHAILSQHIGDLENFETLAFFEETLANLRKLFRVTPHAVAHDLHPQYLSTKYALAIPDVEHVGVQHHHAHIASCMAEHGLEGRVIGVAFDGTGYGTDGRIWGGEFLVADYRDFERRAHLRYIPLAGGDAAVREPWRAALAYLRDTFGDVPDGLLRDVPEARRRVVRQMLERGVNTVATSSCGRLFDAVAAIAGLRMEVNFEGQAAIELEMMVDPGEQGHYGFEIAAGGVRQLDLRPAIAEIVRDLRGGVGRPAIAARFHNTLAQAIAAVCVELRDETGQTRVCLSGGTFQNFTLLERTLPLLRAAGFETFLHRVIPPNDGGIALGQATIAAARLTTPSAS